jgi:hypothetical protein
MNSHEYHHLVLSNKGPSLFSRAFPMLELRINYQETKK